MLYFSLSRFKDFMTDNGIMMIDLQDLFSVFIILPFLVLPKIIGIGLPAQDIPTVTFIF